jgi:proteasome lid subunit RPN8/RPN11
MIKLLAEHISAIEKHGERDYPHECCGLLLGEFLEKGDRRVTETYPISNAREEEAKRNRFLISPEELLGGERYAHEQGLEVIGFYHSHPDCEAKPSQYDLDHAWPTYSYIIVSVYEGSADQLRSWRLEPDRSRFNGEELSVVIRTAEPAELF